MGASPWSFVARFHSEPQVMLREAQEETLRRRAYGRTGMEGIPEATSIDDVRSYWQVDGTGSVLDVSRISDSESEGDFDAAIPFPSTVLESIFSTQRPTRADAEAHEYELLELVERGRTGYVV